MFPRGAWFIICILVLMVLVLVDCGIITPREMEIRRANQMIKKKRPFCNAFTGCGRKRSDPSINNHQFPEEEQNMDNSLNDLIDLNAEPAIEELMRQIMSQAKMWEAIQEASREISAQKIENKHHFPISFNEQ